VSRTDKDLPGHVRAEWWRPWHTGCEYSHHRQWWHYPDRGGCDLPPEPDPRLYFEYRRRARRQRMCMWEPDDDRHPLPPPPRWYVAHVYHRPARQTSRVDCLNAAKEYRATGDVDTIPTITQARNCAQWYWR